MTTHKASHKQVLIRRGLWFLVLAGLMALLAYGHLSYMVAGFIAGAYVLYMLADVDGYVSYNDERLVVARFDLAETISGRWDEISVVRAGKCKFVVRKESENGIEFMNVQPEMFAESHLLRTVLAKRAVMERNERQELGTEAA